jgi:hypothetical protein
MSVILTSHLVHAISPIASPPRRGRSAERPLQPDDASTSIQCWYRQSKAKRQVDSMKVHLWWETRAACCIQRFWRMVLARRNVAQRRARLRGQRAVEQQNRDSARLEQQLIWIFWNGDACHAGASVIQRSWRRRQKRRQQRSSGQSSNATRHTTPGITGTPASGAAAIAPGGFVRPASGPPVRLPPAQTSAETISWAS